MPVGKRFELTRSFAHEKSQTPLPILLLTAKMETEDCIETGGGGRRLSDEAI